MYLKIGRRDLSIPDDEVLAVALVSVMKWNARSLTDVVRHFHHYLRCREDRNGQKTKIAS